MGAIMKQAKNTHFSPPLQFHELVPDLLPLRNLVEQLLVVVQIFFHLKNANLEDSKLFHNRIFARSGKPWRLLPHGLRATLL